MSDYSKTWFQHTFGNGYTESFDADGYGGYKPKLARLVATFGLPEGVALDIGCGSGVLTESYLLGIFKKVYALDVIQRPARMHEKIHFIEAADRDYSCPGIDSDSIDFVWSLGCLCHLSNAANQAYLRSVYRVLKPGGKALLVFADWPKHPGLSKRYGAKAKEMFRDVPEGGLWYYNDEETVLKMVKEAGFDGYEDMMPDFRDLAALLKKPVLALDQG